MPLATTGVWFDVTQPEGLRPAPPLAHLADGRSASERAYAEFASFNQIRWHAQQPMPAPTFRPALPGGSAEQYAAEAFSFLQIRWHAQHPVPGPTFRPALPGGGAEKVDGQIFVSQSSQFSWRGSVPDPLPMLPRVASGAGGMIAEPLIAQLDWAYPFVSMWSRQQPDPARPAYGSAPLWALMSFVDFVDPIIGSAIYTPFLVQASEALKVPAGNWLRQWGETFPVFIASTSFFSLWKGQVPDPLPLRRPAIYPQPPCEEAPLVLPTYTVDKWFAQASEPGRPAARYIHSLHAIPLDPIQAYNFEAWLEQPPPPLAPRRPVPLEGYSATIGPDNLRPTLSWYVAPPDPRQPVRRLAIGADVHPLELEPTALGLPALQWFQPTSAPGRPLPTRPLDSGPSRLSTGLPGDVPQGWSVISHPGVPPIFRGVIAQTTADAWAPTGYQAASVSGPYGVVIVDLYSPGAVIGDATYEGG